MQVAGGERLDEGVLGQRRANIGKRRIWDVPALLLKRCPGQRAMLVGGLEGGDWQVPSGTMPMDKATIGVISIDNRAQACRLGDVLIIRQGRAG